MATKEIVTKVWIEEGCIVCDACETTAPDVFEVKDDTCIIRPDALNVDFCKPRSDAIKDAAEECPVDVIKFDCVTEEVADAAPAPAEAAGEPAKAEAKASPDKPAEETKEPAKAAPGKAPAAGAVKEPDPAIAALLKAATARGGNAGIMKESGPAGPAPSGRAVDLAPEARQAKVQEQAKKVATEKQAARRAFVSHGALAVGWITFGAGSGLAVGPGFVRFLMPNVLEEPDPRVRVGKLGRYVEMAPGGVNEDYKPQGIWMIRLEDRIAALSTICTHLGCIPNWLPNERKFKCPCHGSGYYQNGINFEGPTPRPLERFRLYVADGIVTVDKSKKYQYELGQWTMPGSFILV